jgi:phosphoribosylamine-glycine ligase
MTEILRYRPSKLRTIETSKSFQSRCHDAAFRAGKNHRFPIMMRPVNIYRTESPLVIKADGLQRKGVIIASLVVMPKKHCTI